MASTRPPAYSLQTAPKSSLTHLLDRLVFHLSSDGAASHLAALGLIAGYTLVWWIYAVVGQAAKDIHFDMAEAFSWSQHLAWSYPKHPPMTAWVVAVWFKIFPVEEWAYDLLSATNAGVALLFIWLIAARFVTGPKRVIALIFLTLAPPLNFLVLKFNPNALLVSTWAMASWAFLISLERRTIFWGVVAGAAAAATILAKYWSVFLLAGFAAAVLASPYRWAYLRSRAFAASLLTGLACLAPHIAALASSRFQSFQYVENGHLAQSAFEVLRSLAFYFTGGLAYLIGPAVLLAAVMRPAPPDLSANALRYRAFSSAMLACMAAAFLLPSIVAIALMKDTDPIWTMQCWTLLPAFALGLPAFGVTHDKARGALAVAMVFAVLMAATAPIVSAVSLKKGYSNWRSDYALLSEAVEREWNAHSNEPLTYVAGTDALAWGCEFYCRSHPAALPNFDASAAPWIQMADLPLRGFAVVCPDDNTGYAAHCLKDAAHLMDGAASVQHASVMLTRRFVGISGPPQRYAIFIVPPQVP